MLVKALYGPLPSRMVSGERKNETRRKNIDTIQFAYLDESVEVVGCGIRAG